VRSVCHCCAQLFSRKGFVYVNAIITGSDAEGAGEMFKVTALPFDGTPRTDGKVNYKEDFFGKETNLTVSGQLEGDFRNGRSDIHLWTYI
jgi:asparaginyl-tRNA synthetase